MILKLNKLSFSKAKKGEGAKQDLSEDLSEAVIFYNGVKKLNLIFCIYMYQK
jgi:hypothetical protein